SDTRTVEFLDAGTLGGIVDCYGPGLLDHARRHGPTSGGPPIATTASMRTRTIRSVLEEYEAPHVIDYWSLDTEGSELAVLDGFPFDEYTVRVLSVEHNWTPMRQEIRELLEARGLKWVRELGCDDAYVAADLVVNPGLPSWRSAAWSRRRR